MSKFKRRFLGKVPLRSLSKHFVLTINCLGCGPATGSPTHSRLSGRRAGRSAVVVVVALLVVGIAGVAIVHPVREAIQARPSAFQLASAPLGKTGVAAQNDERGTSDDRSAGRGPLALFRSGQGEKGRPVVMLGRPVRSDDFEGAGRFSRLYK